MFFCSETLGTIETLRHRVTNRSDYKVNMQGFKWSPSNPNPPLESVLKTPFWSSNSFDGLRTELRKAVPTFTTTVGGDYITINTNTGKTTTNEVPVPDSGDDMVLSPFHPTPFSTAVVIQGEERAGGFEMFTPGSSLLGW